MGEWIAVNEPLLDGNEIAYVTECIKSGWISGEGPFVGRFETEFSARVGRSFGVAVSNGSAALDTALLSLGLTPGAEVIMPDFTIISCAAAVIRAGARPVLIDADPLTWNMDVTRIEAKITPRTEAIMAVHLYGLPVDLDPILELARHYGLKVIEDAAEAIGQTYRGRPCGSFGTVSVFSFYANKHLTTGEGGMIVTDDPLLAGKCRSLRNLCFQPKQRFIHDELGFNFRLTNLQAALGLAQLERLDRFIARKKAMGAAYQELLTGLPGVQQPLPRTDYADNNYWVYGLVVRDEVSPPVETIMAKLRERRIDTRPFFRPMSRQPVFHKMGYFKDEAYPVAEKIGERGFYLPSGLALTQEQIIRVAAVARSIFSEVGIPER